LSKQQTKIQRYKPVNLTLELQSHEALRGVSNVLNYFNNTT